MRARQLAWFVAVLAVGVPLVAAAQQAWTPVVVSADPETADRVAADAAQRPTWSPAAAPALGPLPPIAPLPSANRARTGSPQAREVGAAPALMDVAVRQRKTPLTTGTVNQPAPAATPPPATGAPPPAAPAAARADPPPLTTNAARQFCVNIANPAADSKFAWQKRALTDLQQELDQRLAKIEAKTAELQKWVARRDEFANKARENLVLIYKSMKPEAAAQQLSALDEETAAAVLVKLDARTASTILNEMQPAQAARLTATIAGSAATTRKGSEDRKS